MKKYFLFTACLFLTASAQAHDTWVQTNTNLVRIGDSVHIDLMLGNHGNDHRDFKLASKVDPQSDSIAVIGPDGKRYDLKESLADLGYTPKEGFWTTRFTGAQAGMYLVTHTSDHVVSYAPKRSVKSAKTYFVLSESLDKPTPTKSGLEKPLGHPFELLPTTNTVLPMGPGKPIGVQLMFKGKPMANGRVSFIPRGHTLSEKFDPTYERMTDENGKASFTPTDGNYYLVVAHHEDSTESGANYQSTKYSATLTVFVPQLCPCCTE